MTAHYHPGTATPTGGGSTPASNPSGGTPPVQLNPLATQPIGGDVPTLQAAALKYLAGSEGFKGAHDSVQKIHDTVFPEWEGAASREGERVTKMTVSRTVYGIDALANVGNQLQSYAAVLSDAQGKQAQLTSLQAQYQAQPTSTTLPGEMMAQQKVVLAARDTLDQAHTKLLAVLDQASRTTWTVPPFTARFDPITAGILNALVIHHHISPQHAKMVAARLNKLPEKDYKTFAKLESTATSDKQRTKIYTEFATGAPMSKIVASDKAFHTAAPVVHHVAATVSGGAAPVVGVTGGVAPAVGAPALAGRSSGSGSTSKTNKPAPSKPSAPVVEPKGWHPPMAPGATPPKPAPKPSGVFGPLKPVTFTTPAAPAPVHHSAPVHNTAPPATKPSASTLPNYGNAASWPKPAAPAPPAPPVHPSAPSHPSTNFGPPLAPKTVAEQNAAFGPSPTSPGTL